MAAAVHPCPDPALHYSCPDPSVHKVHSHPPDTLSDRIMRAFKIALFLALAGYAGYEAPDYFFSGMVGGMFIGCYMLITQGEKQCRHNHVSTASGCHGDFVRDLTDQHLPPAIAYAGGALVFWEHLGHHKMVMMPLFGVHVGVVLVQFVHGCVLRLCK